ncbi:MAG TPA: sugar isomerase domain-containing protein [Candidatus Didemnitutus sp.]|nr:sugar isomerase domain-containing protein [Candidatus Didemnitutus sp.]
MPSSADNFFDHAQRALQEARERNGPTLRKLGAIIGDSVARGGVIHTFGSGHSEIISREIIGRAGGLVCVSGIYDTTGGFIENLVGYGTKLAERYDRAHGLREDETLIAISNSGKNSSPIEVALYGRQKKMTVVALTSVAMAKTVATVHPEGKKLHEVADYTLDNGCPPGDAIIEISPGVKAGPLSTIVGAMLLNLLSLEVTDWLVAHGHVPPVLRSQNLPGAIEHNRELGRKYHGRLSRQLA